MLPDATILANFANVKNAILAVYHGAISSNAQFTPLRAFLEHFPGARFGYE